MQIWSKTIDAAYVEMYFTSEAKDITTSNTASELKKAQAQHLESIPEEGKAVKAKTSSRVKERPSTSVSKMRNPGSSRTGMKEEKKSEEMQMKEDKMRRVKR